MSSQNINLKNFSFPDSPLSGEEKKEKIKTLRAKLGELQLKIQEQKLPVLVLVEGWGASGKGSLLLKPEQEAFVLEFSAAILPVLREAS